MFKVLRLRSLVMLIVIGIVLGVSAHFLLNSRWLGKMIFPLPYKEVIFQEAAKRDLDPYLVTAIIYVESKFNPEAKSNSGAIGIMQIMPDTGQWAARNIGFKSFKPDHLYDLKTNVVIGCWYLANLRQEFGNNKVIVLAAYNGGRGNVKEWLQQERWTGEHETIEQIPFPETKNYVLRVMAAYQQYKRIYGP